MKKLSILTFLNVLVLAVMAQSVSPQSQYGRVYTILNTKCQNQSCHSATSTGDYLKFDGDSDAVYQQIFNQPSGLWTTSVANHDMLVNPEMPYNSFLLKKIAGPKFDTDLEIDSNGDEGNYMLPVQGSGSFPDTLSNIEIEVVRQWIRFGALEVYTNANAQPDYGTIVQYYTDSVITPFYPKPQAPPAGKGIRLRMGPYFMAITGSYQEQEFTGQQVVYFPYLPQITELSGSMDPQSHHFLLFQYPDSADARTPYNASSDPNGAWDTYDESQVTPSLSGLGILGANPFSGTKNLTGAWQETADLKLPAGTGMMWDQKTYLDFDYHVKNYNATSVLPCDFYLNVYFEPREASTIPMISTLVNNSEDLGEEILTCIQIPPKSLPQNEAWRQDYADGANGSGGTRYLWMTAGHTHGWGTGFWVLRQDTSGAIDTIYNGQYDYVNDAPIGYWDHTHPPLEYWNNGLLPVYYGTNAAGTIKGGLIANTSWFSDTTCLTFGFTTSNEMQLFYYMYTNTLPTPTGIKTISGDENPFLLTIQPNPVNDGDGKLVYVLDKDAKVSAEIIDLSGKVISQLTEENEVAGAHQISINGTQRIAAGIYFARLIVDGSPYVKKFVVAN